MVVFGGHRLWHGFSVFNSMDNHWSNLDEYPVGGYLEDLWFLEKICSKIGRDTLFASVICVHLLRIPPHSVRVGSVLERARVNLGHFLLSSSSRVSS
jgi:hypothetical protein